jgi:hypothetical protein
MALPVPPPPRAFRTIKIKPRPWYRVHVHEAPGHYDADQFNDTARGSARFSPLLNPVTGEVIPTLYAAATREGAIAEIVLHDVPTPSTGHLHDWQASKSGPLHLSELRIGALRLVNLSATGLRAAGLTVQDLFGTNAPDYPRTRAWALYVWRHLRDAQGLYWMSARDNRSEVVLLFGDRVSAGALATRGAPVPIARFEAEVFELLDQLGCGLSIA